MRKPPEIQMYDGDGVETPEARQIRHQREAEEAEARKIAEKKHQEEKKLRRALDYKQSLKDHPLTVAAIRYQIEDIGKAQQKLIILTTMPPEIFNHILEIDRPKMTVRSPMESYHHTVAQIEYPHVWVFHKPHVIKLRWEEVNIDGFGKAKRDGWEKVYQYTLTFTCSKAQDHSAHTYKNLKELVSRAKISA